MAKIDKKDKRITVRLTPYQSFELDNIAKQTGISKAKIVRGMIQRTIDAYYGTQRLD